MLTQATHPLLRLSRPVVEKAIFSSVVLLSAETHCHILDAVNVFPHEWRLDLSVFLERFYIVVVPCSFVRNRLVFQQVNQLACESWFHFPSGIQLNDSAAPDGMGISQQGHCCDCQVEEYMCVSVFNPSLNYTGTLIRGRPSIAGCASLFAWESTRPLDLLFPVHWVIFRNFYESIVIGTGEAEMQSLSFACPSLFVLQRSKNTLFCNVVLKCNPAEALQVIIEDNWKIPISKVPGQWKLYLNFTQRLCRLCEYSNNIYFPWISRGEYFFKRHFRSPVTACLQSTTPWTLKPSACMN